MSRVYLAVALGSLSLLMSAGCGDSLSLLPASGVITYQGKPVEGASVTFIPQSGPPGIGTTDAAGKYTISTDGKPGATPSSNKVTVLKTTNSGGGGITNPKPEDMKKMQTGPNKLVIKNELPLKYADANSSPLSANVAKDKSQFDFTLED